ncbi:MAG TPA: regulatory protein RecX [Solirubrobacteraceae bacterium]|jgi:regulatory protein
MAAAGDRALAREARGLAPAGERASDPEERLQHARDIAWRALGRRDRTEAELADTLTAKRVDPETVATVLGELREGGYVDDARYAQRFAEDRRRLDAWGSDRIERRLRELGVDSELVAAAVGQQDGADELAAAVALLERRFAAPIETPRDRDRALGMLVRKGYELELAYDALRRFAGATELE